MENTPDNNPWITRVVKKLTRIQSIWPCGIVVWHRASGDRLLVEGYKVCADGAILITCTCGGQTDNLYEMELSRAPVPDDEDAWREQPDIDDTKDDDDTPLS